MNARAWVAVVATYLLSGSLAAAAVVDVELADVASWDENGDGDNVVLTLQFAPGATVTGLGWLVDITPEGESWYSEAAAQISDSAGGQAVILRPGILDAYAGPGVPLTYSSDGMLDLTANGIDDLVLADGVLRIEFYEVFDDAAGAVDARWNGTLSVQVIPLPAAVWLMAGGLLALAGWRRRSTPA